MCVCVCVCVCGCRHESSLIVGSHDRRSLQLSKSCISLQLFEISNGLQKDEFNQAYKCAPKNFWGCYVPVRTVASQSKIKFFRGIMFCMRRVVLFTAFYALLSLDSLFWIRLF